jgi:hypothetical protein
MVHMRALMRPAFAVILSCTFIANVFAYGATLLFMHNPGNTNKTPDGFHGMWQSDLATGKTTHMIKGKDVKACSFSPDGKQIAYIKGNDLRIMNSDGTNDQSVLNSTTYWAKCCDSPRDMRWTDRGIFWITNDELMRLIVDTKKVESVMKLHDVGHVCDQSMKTDGTDGTVESGGFVISTDGLRYWARYAQAPKGSGYAVSNWQKAKGGATSLNCATSNNRGCHYFVQFKADYSSYDVVWDSQWGHGFCMTAGGNLMLVKFGSPHRDLAIYEKQAGTVVDTIYSWANRWNPPYYAGYEARPLEACVNNNDIYFAMSACVEKTGECTPDGKEHALLVNWKTDKLLGEFKLPSGGDVANSMKGAHVWDGPLPVTTTTPYIALDKSELTFTYDGANAPAAQDVAVTNKGVGTLGTLTADVSPAADWLTVTVGSGGNSQTVKNAVTAAKIPDGKTVVTVTLSGGDATNKASYTVIAYAGDELAAPSAFKAEAVGDSLLDVKLTWTDNALTEEGYIIERKQGDGAFAEIKKVAKDISSYEDKGLAYGKTYTWRVCAYSGSTKSDYAAEQSVTITGIKWLAFTSPSKDNPVVAGQKCTIAWECNNVTNIYIQASYDEGLSWTTITQEGGILMANGRQQGSFEWDVPADKDISNVMLRIMNYSTDEMLAIYSAGAATTQYSAAGRLSNNGDAIRILNDGRMTVSNASSQHVTMNVYNIAGRIVAAYPVSRNAVSVVNMDSFGAGVYLLELRNAQMKVVSSTTCAVQ